jgi:hypothetical protein
MSSSRDAGDADRRDYLADELSARRKEQVEARLETDGEFFNKAWPLMQARMAVWRGGRGMQLARVGVVRDEMQPASIDDVTEADVVDVYARVRDKLGLPSQFREELTAQIREAGEAAELDTDDGIDEVFDEVIEHDGIVEIEEHGFWRPATWTAEWQRGAKLMGVCLAAAVVFVAFNIVSSMDAGRAANARETAESVEQRTYTGFLPNPRRTDVGPREGRLVELADGSQVLLGPGARLSDEDQALALDGHAEVTVTTSSYLVLHTPVGRALLLHGKYDVDAPIGGLPTLVRVDSGEMHVEGKDTKGRGLVARSGERVRVTPTQAEIVK